MHDHKKILDFLTYLKTIHDDIVGSRDLLRKTDQPLKYIKSELCLTFVSADAFSRFYKLYTNSSDTNLDKKIAGRFKTWISKFVLTKQNKIYSIYRDRIDCDAELIWRLRNSMVHFYGLPKTEEKFGYSLVLAHLDFQKVMPPSNLKIIDPLVLIDAIQFGLLLQLQELKQCFENDREKYDSFIRRAEDILQQEAGIVSEIHKDPN